MENEIEKFFNNFNEFNFKVIEDNSVKMNRYSFEVRLNHILDIHREIPKIINKRILQKVKKSNRTDFTSQFNFINNNTFTKSEATQLLVFISNYSNCLITDNFYFYNEIHNLVNIGLNPLNPRFLKNYERFFKLGDTTYYYYDKPGVIILFNIKINKKVINITKKQSIIDSNGLNYDVYDIEYDLGVNMQDGVIKSSNYLKYNRNNILKKIDK